LVEEAQEREGHEDDRRAFREELTWAERCRLYHIRHHEIYSEAAAGMTLDPLAAMAVLARPTASRVRNNE
jgi:hypothetical protein